MFNFKKILSFFGLLSLLITSILFTGISGQAQGSGTTDMYPGQTKLFTITYENGGDVAEMEEAILEIRIGNHLTLDPTSLKDQYGTEQAFDVVYNQVSNTPGIWGSRISYRPRSAADGSGGTKQPGTVDIEVGTKGKFTFRATLDPNIIGKENVNSGETYAVGSILSPVDIQGINSVLNFSRGNTIPGNFSIKIIEDPNPSLPASTITINPTNPKTKEQLSVTVSNLANNNQLISSGQCEVVITGSGGFTQTQTGTISNGTCQATIPADKTPVTGGSYTITAKVGSETKATKTVSFTQANTIAQATITTNPSEPKIGQGTTVFVNNLVKDGQLIQTGQCQIKVEGTGYNQTTTGNIINGRCEAVLSSDKAPTTVGDYKISAIADGKVQATRTVSFKIAETNILPRTGGVALVFIIASLGGGFSFFIYHLSKKRKMKVN
jgi:hypothetical protein